MNKKELRLQRLNNHYSALERLAKLAGSKITDGKKLSLKLLKIERHFTKCSTDFCNGKITDNSFDIIYAVTGAQIEELLPDISGLYINCDPRGYGLKIDLDKIKDIAIKESYSNLGLERDWGGYLLLSPEID